MTFLVQQRWDCSFFSIIQRNELHTPEKKKVGAIFIMGRKRMNRKQNTERVDSDMTLNDGDISSGSESESSMTVCSVHSETIKVALHRVHRITPPKIKTQVKGPAVTALSIQTDMTFPCLAVANRINAFSIKTQGLGMNQYH